MTYATLIFFQLYYVFLLIPDPLAEKKHVQVEQRRPMTPIKSPIFLEPETSMAEASQLDMIRIAGALFLLAFGAIYTSNLAFQETSVSAATILATTNGPFLLLFGVLFGYDHLSWTKLVAVLFTVVGAGVLLAAECTHSAT